MALGQDNRSR